MNTWAAPGVRCVCIDDDWGWISSGKHSVPTRVPMIGEVLTIRDVEIGTGWQFGGFPEYAYLGFWEINLDQSDGPLHATIRWVAFAFRPLEERKTDIAEIEKLLVPNRAKEDA